MHYQSPSSIGFVPTLYVDISGHLDTKMAALECHRTQVEQSAMVEPDVVVATARHYGAMARISFAEGFRATRFVWDLAEAEPRTDEVAVGTLRAPGASMSGHGFAAATISLPTKEVAKR